MLYRPESSKRWPYLPDLPPAEHQRLCPGSADLFPSSEQFLSSGDSGVCKVQWVFFLWHLNSECHSIRPVMRWFLHTHTPRPPPTHTRGCTLMSDCSSWLFIRVEFPAVCFVQSENGPFDVSVPSFGWTSLLMTWRPSSQMANLRKRQMVVNYLTRCEKTTDLSR